MIYQNYHLATFSSIVDLSTDSSLQNAATSLVEISKPLILQVLQDLKNGNFPLNKFTFGKIRNSNLTKKPGLYLIINKNAKRIYLGSSVDLAQRKGDHNRNFTNKKRFNKVYASQRDDLEKYGPASFYFVPLVVFSSIGLVKGNPQLNKTINEQLEDFFDQHVEATLLRDFIDPNSPIRLDFYNSEVIGKFVANNTRGGYYTDTGTPSGSKAVRYKDLYAWESKSCAGINLLVDRKTIQNKVKAGLLSDMSQEEFNNFAGQKITSENAETYFKNPENAQLLADLYVDLKIKKKQS